MQKGRAVYRRSQPEKMDFFELISTRHSVRAFNDEPINEDVVEKILSAANSAPSARNLQSYKIFVVQKIKDKKSLILAAHDQGFIGEASVILIFCTDLASAKSCGARGENLYSIQDATIACAYAQLAVHALGFSSVWVGSFDEEKIHELFQIGSNFRPVSMLVIGFPREEPEKKGRKTLSDLSQRI